MEHTAIDLGARESQVCVRREDGKILEEHRVATRPEKLRRYLQGRVKSRVIVETPSSSSISSPAQRSRIWKPRCRSSN